MIKFNGKEYPTKEFIIHEGMEDEEEVLVSTTELQDALFDGDGHFGNYVSDEAMNVDALIYYFLNEQDFNLPDEKIIEILEKTY